MVLNDIIEESFADHSKVIELVRGNLLGNIPRQLSLVERGVRSKQTNERSGKSASN